LSRFCRLRSRSCIIDGEAVACDGDDMRRDPLEARKATLEIILAKAAFGILFNEHMTATARRYFGTPASWALRYCVEAPGIALRLRSLSALDQEQESGRARSEARSGIGLGKGALAVMVTSSTAQTEKRMRKILIMGLPGAGKTTLATSLAPLLNAVVFNADAVRANISCDLGFSHTDRIEQARRMGWLCDRVVEAGGTVIADFICPTEETRAAFGAAFTIWLNRISSGRFEDTNRMFVPPTRFDLRVSAEGTPQYWAEQALARLRPSFARAQGGDAFAKSWPRE
jgi:hypothetical protein